VPPWFIILMRKISFVNEKGGSGKTTLTINIGAYIASRGKKVLILDMDPQGHIGKSLGLDVKRIDDTIFDALVNEDLKLTDVIRKTSLKNLDIAPSNKFLTDFVINVASHDDRHLKLTKKIEQLNGYDYLLIDCPPSLGLLTVNILLAVTEVIIPVSLTFLALDGCAEIVDTVRTIKRNFAKNDLDITMVVPTFYRNTNMANAILGKLKIYFGNRVSDTIIKFDVKIDQSQSFGKTIFEFAPDSPGAKMMGELAKEVMAIEEGKLKPR